MGRARSRDPPICAVFCRGPAGSGGSWPLIADVRGANKVQTCPAPLHDKAGQRVGSNLAALKPDLRLNDTPRHNRRGLVNGGSPVRVRSPAFNETPALAGVFLGETWPGHAGVGPQVVPPAPQTPRAQAGRML